MLLAKRHVELGQASIKGSWCKGASNQVADKIIGQMHEEVARLLN